MKNPKNIYEAILPMQRIGRWLGLNPMKENKRTKKVELCKKSIVWSIIFGVGLSVLSYVAQYAVPQQDVEPLSEASSWFDIYSSIFIQIVTVILNCVNIKKLTNFINTVGQLDNLVRKIGHEVPQKAILKLCYFGIFCVFLEYIVVTLPEVVYFTKNYSELLVMTISYLPLITNGIVKLQFVTFIYIIFSRFRCINKILYDMGYYTTPIDDISYLNLPRYFNEFNRNVNRRKLKVVHNIHNILCDLCNRINFLYGLQIIIITGSDINITITELFYCYRWTKDSKNDIPDLYFSIQWITIQQIEIFMLILICCKVKTETNKAIYHLHTLKFISKDEELNKLIGIFSLHQMHKNVEFTAFGLFPLNYSFLLTIYSTITSYLVIMIQYDMALPNNKMNITRNTNINYLGFK